MLFLWYNGGRLYHRSDSSQRHARHEAHTASPRTGCVTAASQRLDWQDFWTGKISCGAVVTQHDISLSQLGVEIDV
jgi:hypothetical protein